MSSLLLASEERAYADGFLPDILPGGTQEQRIKAAWKAARDELLKVTDDLSFDSSEAEKVSASIAVWIERNGPSLEAQIKSGTEVLPADLALALGTQEEVRQWTLFSYFQFASGANALGTGLVEQAKDKGLVPASWESEYAREVELGLRSVVGLGQKGILAQIFSDGGPVSGVGALPVPALLLVAKWLIVSFTVLGAVYIASSQMAKVAKDQNGFIAGLCRDKVLDSEQCAKALTRAAPNPLKDITEGALKLILVAGGAYVFMFKGVPLLVDEWEKRRD